MHKARLINGDLMTIKSDNFVRIVLSDDDAVQFVNHMKNDKPNEKAKVALARGRQVLARLKNKTS